MNSAPKKHIIETGDLELQAESLTNWKQTYDQTSAGKFYGRTEKIDSTQFHIFQEYTSHALHQDCQLWRNAMWIGVPFAHQKDSRINGQLIRDNTLACQFGEKEFELVTPEQFSIYGVVIEETMLAYIAEIENIDLVRMQQNPFRQFTIKPQQMELILSLLNRFMSQTVTGATLEEIKQDFILGTILQDLPVNSIDTPQVLPSYRHRKQVVDRVRTYLNDCRNNTPVTMSELCDIAHVSRRTLQYSFQTILGCSPLRFLRTMRLNEVRRTLKASDGEKQISDIASNWGFWHAGQFSQDYKQLFGELPSETVKKAKKYK
ncbi:helix-turn-helix domain-containing protein [Thiomicrorhabdus indica]|uniref:helix-turn-helix domain-containing protein n=1 Tax=Thiomicrorhabdus indica TaxID=2267253 RepID=UPI002AA63B31|nr:helix-turn-helix domain-containing protein [Thiomicrorhabdus indica]